MLTFKDFLNEAPRKPKVKAEPNWAEDYASGYERLSRIKEPGPWTKPRAYELQLFVPKDRRKDDEWAENRKRDKRWRETADEITEASIPVLVSRSEQPPGQNKPGNAFWTSTAIKKKDGTYDSQWLQLVRDNYPRWQTDYGYLFEVSPQARVFDLDDADRFFEWAWAQQRLKLPHREWNGYEGSREDAKARFPWDELAKHFDCVHNSYGGRSEYDRFNAGWDVESTAWFDTSVLKYKGAVKVSDGYEENDE